MTTQVWRGDSNLKLPSIKEMSYPNSLSVSFSQMLLSCARTRSHRQDCSGPSGHGNVCSETQDESLFRQRDGELPTLGLWATMRIPFREQSKHPTTGHHESKRKYR